VRAWRYAAEANKAIGQIKHTLLKDAPLDLGVDWLKVNLPKDTKVLNLSHVAFNTGRKVDLLQIGKFLKTRDILFIVDGTQAFGGIYYTKEELNLIDCLVCSTYKWLLGPYGSSFAYYSNRLLAQMNILQGSWLTSIGFTKRRQIIDYSLDPLSGARPYDRGQAPNLLNTAGLEGSLSLFSELGLKSIYEHNQKLTHFFVENLKAKNLNIVAPKSCLSNIICLKSLTDTEQLQAKLQKNNIDISIRDGNLRISFHLFNHMTQVESLLSVLNQ
jgi:selenocysteine lyase/cysteine desulfurase